MTEPRIYSVGELSRGIKNLLETSYREIWVEGEISGYKVYPSGHAYFDLKDETSSIASVLFKGFGGALKFEPQSGLLVRARGNVTAYDKTSKYQLMVKELQPAGIGPLQLAFEQLKKKLAGEGLFDQGRKRPIPALPQKIGVVTSPAGAAIRDILSILKRRYANLHIIIAPVKVQGEGSKEEIAQAIKDLNAGFPDIDVLLVGRGGGSIEDLWAFNEEIVARAIAGSKIPVISCVGHETDFTIADFVADLRAPTPSAAAELVVKSKEELAATIAGLERRLLQSLRIYYENLQGKFRRLVSSRPMVNPLVLLERPLQRLDQATEGLYDASSERLRRASEKLNLQTAKLNALSPLFPLRKGYAIVKDAKGKAVKTAATLAPGDRLSLQFSEGKAQAEVVDNGGAAADKPRAQKKGAGKAGPDQETLW
ncbi:MAG TPA: exodeoxyribonuclease VII large subunit [Elusimicrobia bacterium]|nr:MAG: exodeoxyribonuclease VII large subunit [Elusimicrobia bacterium GWD2_63_28]HCC48792.1 exodeoxyribonuclease VII large subunit [Elusimicrobiota bacterium]